MNDIRGPKTFRCNHVIAERYGSHSGKQPLSGSSPLSANMIPMCTDLDNICKRRVWTVEAKSCRNIGGAERDLEPDYGQ